MFDVPLRGGLRQALATAGDRVSPDRSQFLLEVIRRSDHARGSARDDRRRGSLRALLTQLAGANTSSDATISTIDTIPLPLPPEIWIKVVFDGHAKTDTLVASILESRSASLLYCGLLALDDTTREWLATRPDLVAFLARHSAAFVVAAPGLRVANGRIQLPGGDRAGPVWEAVVDRHALQPEEFIAELLTRRGGRVAYFLSAIAQLTSPQVRVALNLDAPDTESRVTGAKRLYEVFEHIASTWNIEQHTFWRPALDPALLLSELRVDEQGVVRLPTARRGFWDAVLSDGNAGRGKAQARGRSDDSGPHDPLDFAGLSERVFAGTYADNRRRYIAVLFASRMLDSIPPRLDRDAIDAVRAAIQYPALTAVLERGGLTDIAAFAAAARRAARLAEISDPGRAARALAEFQGALALIARATIRGSLARDSLPRLVSSLSALSVSERGDYEGRVVRWIEANLIAPLNGQPSTGLSRLVDAAAPGPAEGGLLRLLAGPSPTTAESVEWEGTRYRVDLSVAEAMRLLNVLGDGTHPYVSAARALVVIGDAFGSDSALIAADALIARGLTDLAYAAAFGQRDASSITAGEAAGRHDFGAHPWHLPEPDYDESRQWHMTGSLLGLDVRLAQLSLLRTSLRPPPLKPSIDDTDRQVFTEAVSLIDPASLSDADRDVIVTALNAGRARVATIRTTSDAMAVADDARLGPTRRTLLEWAIAHEPERAAQWFSLTELLWLGLRAAPVHARLDAWGAVAEPRLGCLCLRFVDRRPLEMLAGRWDSGFLASTFADLNLRLAELLADLQMPSVLLGPVLSAATVDLVENAESRDQDDRRGLVEFVRHLNRERVEEYLALLTTDGPLVVVSDQAIPPPRPPRSPR